MTKEIMSIKKKQLRKYFLSNNNQQVISNKNNNIINKFKILKTISAEALNASKRNGSANREKNIPKYRAIFIT